jgi:Peptidase inhibitor family I36
MKKAIAAFVAMSLALIAPFVVKPAAAQASTYQGCPDAYVCIYKDINWGTPMSGYPSGTIEFNPGGCWLFNSSWNDQMSSYVINFASSSGEYVTFWADANCSGSSFSETLPPQAWAKMPNGWNDRVSSISVRKP